MLRVLSPLLLALSAVAVAGVALDRPGLAAVGLAGTFGVAWWMRRREPPVPPPSPDDDQRLDDDRRAHDEAFAAETAEWRRVETALVGMLEATGTAHRVRPPIGGHMDKRETDYVLGAPLPVTDADLGRLAGPLTQIATAGRPGGGLALVRLSARDCHGGGLEVRVGDGPERLAVSA